MILSRTFEPPDLVAATVTGVLTDEDQAELVRWVRDWIGTIGSVRVLLVLHRFAGWRPSEEVRLKADTTEVRLKADTTEVRLKADTTAPSPQSIWLGESDAVSRIAVVGDPAWKAAVLTMVAQPINPIPIAYFASQPDAREWLGAPLGHHAGERAAS